MPNREKSLGFINYQYYSELKNEIEIILNSRKVLDLCELENVIGLIENINQQ